MGQPINPNHPEFWYLNPTAYAPAKVPGKSHYRMRAKFKLPEGVSCDNCVLQCLNKYGPLKRVDFEQGGLREAQPINPNHPEFWYLNPTAYAPAKVPGTTHYRMRARFKLPEG